MDFLQFLNNGHDPNLIYGYGGIGYMPTSYYRGYGMHGGGLLDDIDRYYMFVVNNTKAILLAQSDSKSDLRLMSLKKLGLNCETDKTNKYNGLHLYRVKITSVPKKDLLNDKMSKIKMIGGPVVAVIERIQINIDNGVKLVSIDENEVNNKVYFSSEYIKKHGTINLKSINKIAFNFAHNKFNKGLFAINTIND